MEREFAMMQRRAARLAWNAVILGGLGLAGMALQAQQTYMLGPDSQVQPGVPQGTVTRHELAAGKIYPGTPHTYWVYVPAGLDAKKPAAVMIFLDGSGFMNGQHAPVVLDNLIARHEVPPLIGVFIDPGVLPVVGETAQNRYERIFEYDSLSDRFSRFLLTELLPEVAKIHPLSANPDDRAIAGVSTGAVGAFMAAWNRPDQFHRVLSYIGTYVAMKGADSMPALVRKTEPKPIRVFMQDGKNDHILPGQPWGWSFAGSWPIQNQVMYEALKYAGYDATLVMGDGAHDTKQAGAILPDALRWLWRGYPEPIVVKEPASMTEPGWDPRGKPFAIVSASEGWQRVGDASSVAGLSADDAGSAFFFDRGTSRIYKADAAGTVTVWKEGISGVGALRAGADGALYAAQPGLHRIVRWNRNASGRETVVASEVTATGLAVTRDGTVYFADAEHQALGWVNASGHVQRVSVAGQMAAPSGIALSGDQAVLVAADSQSRFSWSFQIGAKGELLNGEPFYRLEMPEAGWMSGASAVAEDTAGLVYFATPMGVQVCEANGRMASVLNAPEPGAMTEMVLTGSGEKNWIYGVEGGKLFRRAVKVKGTLIGSPGKLPKPPL
ncbi:MAG: putative esterase [Acidobacteriaceae bacterium]|nr:putative esterase [Acidobacteriaceae bacterium]